MPVKTDEKGFVLCPRCGRKTKVKVTLETELKKFPLFCPWCKKETTINK